MRATVSGMRALQSLIFVCPTVHGTCHGSILAVDTQVSLGYNPAPANGSRLAACLRALVITTLNRQVDRVLVEEDVAIRMTVRATIDDTQRAAYNLIHDQDATQADSCWPLAIGSKGIAESIGYGVYVSQLLSSVAGERHV